LFLLSSLAYIIAQNKLSKQNKPHNKQTALINLSLLSYSL
jgi:hypothetical protein